MRRILCLLPVVLLLAACATQQAPAPIVERQIPEPGKKNTITTANVSAPAEGKMQDSGNAATYTVKRGDTLYRIAFEHGLSYRDLATWNNLANPGDIKVDQVLRLTAPATPTESANGVEVRPLQDATNGAAPAAKPRSVDVLVYPKAVKLPYSQKNADSIAKQAESEGARPAVASMPKAIPVDKKRPQEKPVANGGTSAKPGNVIASGWIAPTSGKLLKAFSEEAKGIDIGGKIGQSIVASEGGKVVYAGTGLRGYGKMVIIKHDNAFLSAYAHNNKLLVKEGDAVKKGEKIAEMGNTDADRVKLHFEVRKFGKPVDPTKIITVIDHE